MKNDPHNFRLLAIKTGANGNSVSNFLKSSTKGLEIDYLKNLRPNYIYRFYDCFEFPENDFNDIEYIENRDHKIFSINANDKRSIPVNISAIVGENGSGKSSLTELIYWINYNLGCKYDLLYKEHKDGLEELYQPQSLIELDLLYQVNDDLIYQIRLKGNYIRERKINKINGKFDSVTNFRSITKYKKPSDFFYSVVVNYSQYSLNSKEIGDWVIPLFHKNDGYQTPLVINPMREKGIIDINNEKLLLSRRLQANILLPLKKNQKVENSLRNLANGKIAKSIKASLNENYFDEVHPFEFDVTEAARYGIREAIKKYYKIKITSSSHTGFKRFYDSTVDYIYYKLKKIVFNYPVYSGYRNSYKARFEDNEVDHLIEDIKDIDRLLKDIYESNSHIVFKIKGAILHLKYFNNIYKSSNQNFDYPFEIDINQFSNFIQRTIISKEEFQVNTYMMALPSFFNVEIVPSDGVSFGSFSSGEKQKIFSLSSIVYHLINLNSVEEKQIVDDEKNTNQVFKKFRYINIVLDEIEMYYHPEWQRTYIKDLLDYLAKIHFQDLENIKGINILFVTHSPFILSDLPVNNVLYLERDQKDGMANQVTKKRKTFGANIHELLTDSFFFKDNKLMGEFAHSYVVDLISELQTQKKGTLSKEEFETYLSKINLIGDHFISKKLTELVFSKYGVSNNQEKIKKQIELREAEIEDLKKSLNH